ncbi:MAG: hypothetical protein JW891_16240 [Candidatus Lokiarchaeota archaeon]|nr:hypothetical protein [Candidatus Lokiarchaeota archaeon]
MSLWKVIAKYEIKRGTSSIRKHRVLILFILYAFLIIWAVILAPLLFDAIMPPLVSIIPYFEETVALIIEALLMMLFLVIMMYPINTVFRKTEIGYKEILLASPATEGDIFIGEFVGKFLVYMGAILIFAPILLGLINAIINFTVITYIIIYACVMGHVIFALLIGNILASLIEHKIARNPKFKDLGKVFLFLISIGMVAIIYTLQFAFQILLENPELKNWLMFYPSLWFSNIILYSINPNLISTYVLNIWSSVLLIIFVPLLVFYIAYKKASKFFTLEGGIEKISDIIEKESSFYKQLRKYIPHNWETLIVSQLKEFFRRKENIMKLVYTLGITLFIGTMMYFTSPADTEALSAEVDAIFTIMILFVSGMIYCFMIGNYIFVGSRDLLWVYKKSPRGVKTLVYSYIRALTIPSIFIGIITTIYYSILYQYTVLFSILFFVLYLVNITIILFQACGIQCFNPSFEEKGKQMGANIMIQMFFMFFILFISIFLLFNFNLFPPIEEDLIPVFMYLPILLLSLAFTIPVFYFGIRRLGRIE